MEIVLQVLLAISLIGFILIFWLNKKKKTVIAIPPPAASRKILEEQVPFYQQLDENNKKEFEKRVEQFLASVKITGVKTTVEDLDKVLIASSAVIPIFNFPGWEYCNLNEVLLYPESFDHEFQQEGEHRSIIGMVGSGALNNVMILSQHELRQAFINKTGKDNTAIHEFVHLLDKTDGSVDGVPELLLEKKYIMPWLQLMQKKIQLIMDNRSDINPYGATNEAEFFAVVSEYFFERPKLLKEKHPDLYALLEKIFRSSRQ
jgi:MtfA peptidase